MKKSTHGILMANSLLPALLVSGCALLNRYFVLGALSVSSGILPLSAYFLGLQWVGTYYSKTYSRRVGWLTIAIVGLFIGLGSGFLQGVSNGDSSLAVVAIWEICPNGWLLLYVGLLVISSSFEVNTYFVRWFSTLWSGCIASLLTSMMAHLIVLGLVELFGQKDGLPFIKQLLWGTFLSYSICTLLLGGVVEGGRMCLRQWARWIDLTCATEGLVVPSFYQVVLQFFCVACLMTNIWVVKCVTICGYCVTAGVFPYVLTFVCTDVIAELFGWELAKRTIWAGFAANVVLFMVVMGVGYLPLDVRGLVTATTVVESFYFVSASIVASVVAYLVAQFTDVYIFDFLKKKTHKRHLWLRNNAATFLSQLVDTLLYAVLAWGLAHFVFGGSVGTLPWSTWYVISRNEYVLKMLLALLDTPIVYILIYGYRRYCEGFCRKV